MASRRATCRTISAGDGPWSGRSSQVPRKPGSWPLYNRSQQPTQIEPFNMLRSLGISPSGDEYGRLKSLEGVYAMYRRAWLHPGRHDLAIRSLLKIYRENGL